MNLEMEKAIKDCVITDLIIADTHVIDNPFEHLVWFEANKPGKRTTYIVAYCLVIPNGTSVPDVIVLDGVQFLNYDLFMAFVQAACKRRSE